MLFKEIASKLFFEISNKIPTILTDNTAALKLAENPKFHRKTKHIEIAYHFIREEIR